MPPIPACAFANDQLFILASYSRHRYASLTGCIMCLCRLPDMKTSCTSDGSCGNCEDKVLLDAL
ncbi:hypothetical protein HETIRDRAFT_170051 [Heterobasidion irregulare TC 32-1]|uniref:Uncharacterized protein n=1 Tax=Heterobasidion irregulare (strain TC 32-1) TaxID=747525 RepID=W4KCK1_HETIT|nr:uncharacterized protein HETIRDRAFT_170051 [Heterobasidion irregulare TC 32-1]ETW83597.1 hypothetical protein HETIRDRAFT_170051 [Heterobasidion irregulare TC 32-1]